MPTAIVTWVSIPDKKRCKTCEVLHDYQWVFEDTLPPLIQHPQFGIVWDVELNTSMAHEFPMPSIHCRCYLDIQIDDSDVSTLIEEALSRTNSLNEDLALQNLALQQFISLLRHVT